MESEWILIIKTSAMGDVILTLAAVFHLKKQKPTCRIAWLVEKNCAELLRSCPWIDEVLVWEKSALKTFPLTRKFWREFSLLWKQLRRRRYASAVDLQGNIKSGFLLWAVRAKLKAGFTWKYLSEWPAGLFLNRRYSVEENVSKREQYVSLLQQHFSLSTMALPFPPLSLRLPDEWKEEGKKMIDEIQQASGKKVLIAPFSRWPNKEWGILQWRTCLLRLCQEIDCHFWVLSHGERESALLSILSEGLSGRVTALPSLPLPLLQKGMEQMDLIVSVDSMALHLASTTLTPTLSLFGSSHPHFYAPGSFVWGHCPYGKVFEDRCPILRTCRTGYCMKGISVDQVLPSILASLTKSIE